MPHISPMIIGHRGASGYRPEHTRAAYELAFEMGVDAVEPDVVATADGVLVVRHENEISGTTDVADHPEFADRKTTKTIDGMKFTGWFTEDFTWAELQTLRCRERIAELRSESARFDGEERMLRLTELLDLIRAASEEHDRSITLVLEVKHATYFAGIGLDLTPLIERDLHEAGWATGEMPLVIESFEPTVLSQLRERGIVASYIFLIAPFGTPVDLVVSRGDAARSYLSTVTPEGLDELVGRVDGISVYKDMLLAEGNTIVPDAHARGLQVFTWTARPENEFLSEPYRGDGAAGDFGDYEAEWAVLAASGIDGVFVDHPDLGVQVFRR